MSWAAAVNPIITIISLTLSNFHYDVLRHSLFESWPHFGPIWTHLDPFGPILDLFPTNLGTANLAVLELQVPVRGNIVMR